MAVVINWLRMNKWKLNPENTEITSWECRDLEGYYAPHF